MELESKEIGLLIDCSDKLMSIGVVVDSVLKNKRQVEAWQRQSELLIPAINEVFFELGLKTKSISYVVVSKGPGSYTGVRIALSVAKTICFALKAPLYLVSSLWALRNGNKKSLCLMNARSKRSYVGVYEGNECLLQDCVMTNDEVLSYIKEHQELSVCGDVAYLGVEGISPDIPLNLVDGKDSSFLVADTLAAKPVYLKDNYEIPHL